MDINIIDFIRQSGYEPALRLEKLFPKRYAGALLAVVAVLALPATFFYFPASEILLAVFLTLLVYWLFLDYLERRHEEGISFFAISILSRAAREDQLSLPDFYKLLLKNHRFQWILRRLNVDLAQFGKSVDQAYPEGASLALDAVVGRARQKANASNHLDLHLPDFLAALYGLDKTFQKILFDSDVEESDLLEVGYWQRRRERQRAGHGKFWSAENLLDVRGIGKDWGGGWTVNLDRIAVEITEGVRISQVPIHLHGRRTESNLLERMLVRSAGSSNVVLVGQPGVGRHTVLRAFASRVNSGQTFGPLRYQRILQIDSASVLSGTVSLNDVVARIKLLFGEAYAARNVILVINDLDAFLDSHPEAGRVNATEALLPFFKSELKIIGITTPQGYQNTIGKNPELMRLISKLEIGPLSPAQTLLVLQDEVEHLEYRSGLFFIHAALKEIIKLSERLILALPNPEKSLEVLEEVAVYAATEARVSVVLPEHVQKVVSLRTKVPVEKVEGQEVEVLLNLEILLHRRVIGQDQAIKEIADALRRARAGIASGKRPIGSFLFLGPTGVGKTETAKALAEAYFGGEKRMIRFDMTEYQEQHSVERLIGNADLQEGGQLTEAVINNPFCLILLDEFEKSHPKIMDLFLQVFDEGRLTDVFGRTVDFINTMIIATSNAGAESIREMVNAGRDLIKAREEILDSLQRQHIFRPEFLNRFDAVVLFRPHSEEDLVQVATLLLEDLNRRLAEKDVQIKITPELALAIARGGYDPEFGARPLRRFIQENIENYIAKKLISGEIKKGQVVDIHPSILEK